MPIYVLNNTEQVEIIWFQRERERDEEPEPVISVNGHFHVCEIRLRLGLMRLVMYVGGIAGSWSVSQTGA